MANRFAVITGLILALASSCAAAPRVVSVDPPDGAKDVRTSSNIRVDFDSVMDASTITTSTVLLDGKPLSEVPGAAVVHPDGKSAVLLLRLVQNNSYRFTLTTDIRNSAGEALAEAYTWQFVTASRMDEPDTPVRVFARYPRMNDFGIPTNAPITMTFTTEMDAESFGADSVIVRKTTGGQPVPGNVTVKGSRVIFRPDAPLAANQPYEAVMSANVKSRWGSVPVKDSSWQFTTGDGPAEGFIVADAWYETYQEPAGTRFVFHAAVEELKTPGPAGKQPEAAASAPPQSPAFEVRGTVVSLSGILPQQPLSTPNDADASKMPVSDGSAPASIQAAYTHGGGAGPGNSVDGNSTKDPLMDKVRAAVRDALAQDSAVTLRDSGDIAICGDSAKDDGVFSGRMTLPASFPDGQAYVAYTLVPEGEKPMEPVTIAVYLLPTAQNDGRGAPAEQQLEVMQ